MAIEIKLPELGENISGGRVTAVQVTAGQQIAADEALFELETDKAVIEVPAPQAGVIEKVLIKEGQDVKVGQVIVTLKEAAAAADEKPVGPVKSEPVVEMVPAAVASQPAIPTGKTKTVDVLIPDLGENISGGTVSAVLVRTGQQIEVEQAVIELETDKAVIEVPCPLAGVIEKITVKTGQQVKVGQAVLQLKTSASPLNLVRSEDPPIYNASPVEVDIPAGQDLPKQGIPYTPSKDLAPAAPSVRRFAREIGLDINEVKGSGPAGRISLDDVKAWSKTLNRQRKEGKLGLPGVALEPLPDFSRFGLVRRETMNKVRETTARHLSYAWSVIPHVTQFDKADITELENLRKSYGPMVEKAGGKLTMTAILMKISAIALKKFPKFNTSIDMERMEIIFKDYVHIGVAVDTDRGLLVPVVRNVDQKNITELSVELALIAEKARHRKLSIEDMQGGNFTISNLGGIGGIGFTPVVNSPEVAIMGVSRSSWEPVYQDGAFVPRFILPFSLSYDHRIIDGAEAARFLRWIAEALQEPFKILLEG